MGLYETFMLGFAVLVILAGVVFSVAAAFMPGPQRHQRPTPPNSAAAGGADGDGANASFAMSQVHDARPDPPPRQTP